MQIWITVAILSVFLSACTSFKTAKDQSTEDTISNLSIGDTVELVTVDGSKESFTITAIEEDALVGDETRVPIDVIRIVSVEGFDSGRTAIAGGLTFGVIAAIGAAIFALTLP